MPEQQHPFDHGIARPRRNIPIGAAFAGQPASFWVASLASLCVIIGGVGPWATWVNLLSNVSISGTSMHGWREVAVGAIGLAMLGLYQVRGGRLPLLVTGVVGALGVAGAVTSLNDIVSGGTVTVFGVEYRYIDVAWGLYLVLAGTITLVLCACALMWRDFRATRQASM